MPSGRLKMISALRNNVVTTLREKGFKGSFPHFRRITDKKIDLLTFQFDKYGGGFVVEVAKCSPKGLTHHWGEKVPPNKVTAHDVHPDDRLRLNDGPDDWFRYDLANAPESIYEKVAIEVLNHLDEAEAYWDNSK